MKCKKCGTGFDMECQHSSGFSSASPGWFRRTNCKTVNKLDMVMGEPGATNPEQACGCPSD